jgi:hypothetical protein
VPLRLPLGAVPGRHVVVEVEVPPPLPLIWTVIERDSGLNELPSVSLLGVYLCANGCDVAEGTSVRVVRL